MIGVLLLFVILTVIIYFGIRNVQKITGKEFIQLTKIGVYVIISLTLAMLLMFGLVILF